ncbi:hypothetical protein [Maricaulis sp.]|uniref:hypothetical protein n=1 Tax=Maricaulis sp. TaxID=1486257 RepID=UPI003A94BBDE
MTRSDRMTWQCSARYVALASWALAAALTAGMGWQAWMAVRDASGAARYESSEFDTTITSTSLQAAARIVAGKNRNVN